MSQAVDAVSRGVTDYNSAIRASMRKLGGDGLRVEYESGVTRRMDTAIRMNILDSVRQVSMEAAKMAGEEIGADGVELSAHPFSALDHEDIQGRMYSMENYEKMQSEHPFEDVDGKQYDAIRRPITQWNCRHFASPVILGISQRRYTDEQLEQWKQKNHAGCEIDGKHYTVYQASQLMRKLETEVRRQKDITNLAKASGDDVLRREAQAKIVGLKAKYKHVAEQAKLRARPDKMVVESYKNKENDFQNVNSDGIITETEMFKKTPEDREGFTFISDDRFNALTAGVKKKGAIILRGSQEVEEHLRLKGASASQVGEFLFFSQNVTVSDVLEEVFHYYQKLEKINDGIDVRLQTILNEIDAKKHILSVSKQYRVPRIEQEHLLKQIESYEKELNEFYGK